ncbi:MAG TPA: ABC transporter ATP-binding protein [Acidimicrobiia bacterium]|nr:ABC transporter ATP-binding protein [Acidimicrobiia bacterium]
MTWGRRRASRAAGAVGNITYASEIPASQQSRAGSATPLVASVTDLKVHFQTKAGMVHAVDGVSFEIRDGETLGLVGETGCGKSVTARSFIRLVPTPPGVYAGGQVLFWSSDARREGRGPIDLLTIPDDEMLDIRGDRIAMIFQDPGKALNPALSIRNQIAEVFYQHRSEEILQSLGPWAPRMIRRAARQEATGFERLLLNLPPFRARAEKLREKVDQLVGNALSEVQIPNPRKIMDSYPHELSGGMKQRVLIAQALACNPDLLIADEPTTALDVTIQARILELIAELQERLETSVLYISHDLSLVKEICDRVAVMYAGRIVETGTTDEVFSNPKHPYTRGLMAAVPSAAHRRGELASIVGNVPELLDPEPSCRFNTRCPYAVEICRTVDPRTIPIGESQSVACFAYESDDSDVLLPRLEAWVS